MRAAIEMSNSVKATSMILSTWFFPDRACAHSETKAIAYFCNNLKRQTNKTPKLQVPVSSFLFYSHKNPFEIQRNTCLQRKDALQCNLQSLFREETFLDSSINVTRSGKVTAVKKSVSKYCFYSINVQKCQIF